jgi:hypothetical protein
LFGAHAVTSKETYGAVVVVSLAAMLATDWILERRQTAKILATTLAGYCVAVLAVALSSGLGTWWDSKYDDVLRALGVRQETGFNAPTVHVSLASRVLADATQYATTYVILALGSLAAVGLIWRLRPWRAGHPVTRSDRTVTLVALWTLIAGGYLFYATVFGSIEEQMYYILLAPAIASLTCWLALRARFAKRPRLWRCVAAGALAVVLAMASLVWVGVHTRPDDEYRVMLAWEAANVPAGSVIAVTEETAQFLSSNAVLGQWDTIPELVDHHVQYVLLSTNLVKQGYGVASTAFLQILNDKGRIVFEVNGPSDGSLRLYDVTAITGAPKPCRPQP